MSRLRGTFAIQTLYRSGIWIPIQSTMYAHKIVMIGQTFHQLKNFVSLTGEQFDQALQLSRCILHQYNDVLKSMYMFSYLSPTLVANCSKATIVQEGPRNGPRELINMLTWWWRRTEVSGLTYLGGGGPLEQG